MESGYHSAIYKSCGVYGADGGKAEKKLAERYAAIAEKLRERGFSRLARVYDYTATGYCEQAEREKINPDLQDRGHY